MKKFREFYVITENENLRKACFKHGVSLGYSASIFGFKTGIVFQKSGECYDFYGSNHSDKERYTRIALDEFFALTPEDVIVEPDKADIYSCFMYEIDGHTYGFNSKQNQGQIDRIKAIMNEVSE